MLKLTVWLSTRISSVLNVCCATLCVSEVLAVGRCPCDRPSHWCVVSRRQKISSEFFLGQAAPYIILGYVSIWCYPILREPLCGGIKYWLGGKFEFLANISLCLGNGASK